MDLNKLISYLLSSQEFSDNLEIMKHVITSLDLSPKYPIILIGGTNGKGSTCSYLSTILSLSGYKVGTFTSPHMFSYNERICINKQAINDDDLTQILDQVINHCPENLGLFKTFTLAAHLHFIQQKVDIAIIEVGIGGLHDATNLFEPAISAITTIGYDHCQLLGTTLDAIGLQKAGIFRAGKPAFIGMQHPPQSIIEYAKSLNTSLYISGTNFGYIRHDLSFDVWCDNNKYFSLPHPALRGSEQLDNASLAIAILTHLKQLFPIPLSAIKTGMLQTTLPGRLTILTGQPQTILDVAHNPQAVSQMLKNMLKLAFAKHNYAIFGIANDKDIAEVIKLARDHFSKWFIAPINSARHINNADLIQIMQECNIDKNQIVAYDSISLAFNSVRKICTNDDRIVCFGSFLVVEEVYRCN